MMSRRGGLWVSAGVGLVVLLVGRWAAVASADRWWAETMGVAVTHRAIARLQLALLALAFTGAAVWALFNLYLVYRSIGSVHVPRRLGNIEILEAVPRRYLLYGTVLFGLALAVLLSHGATNWWYAFALRATTASIGTSDPVLHRDLAYYLFRLPWDRTLHAYLVILAAVLLVVCTTLYGVVGAIRVMGRKLEVAEAARKHLAGLLAVFAVALAVGFRLDPAEYVAGLRGVPYDAVLLDVRLPVSRLLSGIALAVSLASLLWVWVDRVAIVVVSWTALAVLALVGTFLVPGFAATVRDPDQLAVPGLLAAQSRLLAVGFALPQGTPLQVPALPDSAVVERGIHELSLAPLWDAPALTDVLNRNAAGHSYERFAGVSLDAYRRPDGQLVPIYVGAREVDLLAAREADAALSWASVHAGPYTSAPGAVAVAAATVSPEGLPVFVSSLARPDSTLARAVDLPLDQPGILFSPSAEEYAVLPSGASAGIPPDGLWRRLALAWTLQSPRLLSPEAAPADRVVLWHRSVIGRLEHYAPFAQFGAPWPVVVGGRLLWLSWGYVTAEAFPLSLEAVWRREPARYARASLLGTVDAHTGATAVYLVSDPDPLSAAWARLAPDIVRPVAGLPAAMATHLRYPAELFALQLAIVAGRDSAGEPPTGRLPRQSGPRVAAPAPQPARGVWLVGTLAGDDTLRLRLRATVERGDPPLLTTIVDGAMRGTHPVLRVVRPTPTAAHRGPSQFDVPAGTGSDQAAAMPGSIRTYVFDRGIIMLRAVFDVPGPDAGVPRLREVVARYEGAVGRGPSKEAALADLRAATRRAAGTSAEWTEARQWFRRLDDARRAGDWTAFGRAYDRLRRLLTEPGDSVP